MYILPDLCVWIEVTPTDSVEKSQTMVPESQPSVRVCVLQTALSIDEPIYICTLYMYI